MRLQAFLFTLTLLSGINLSASKPQSVGLVLSGGGAKGIAHIGVIQALEDHNIPIDYIAGTSMGAIVGGLYAAGFTPDEMMSLIESESFAYWSTGKIDKRYTYFLFQDEPTPQLASINIGPSDSTETKSILPTSLINPLPMNFGFMELFSAYTAQCGGDFNRLFVPFRCVTSDIYSKHKIVCSSGSLGDAIRASMSFPLVFHPIEMDGVLVYDGGIYDNFPVDVMHEDFAPGIMIGVDVSNPDTKPKANDLIQQLEDMIIQNNDYSLPSEYGIKIKVDLSDFALLDFAKAREIYAIGYKHAMEMMDSIESRVTSRIPTMSRTLRREVFKSKTPYVHFDSVNVSGGTKSQNEYLKYLFTHNQSDTFGLRQARDAYYRAITPGKLQNLVPHAIFNPNDSLFTLDLKASVKDNFKLGFGGYISSSTSSMLFFSGGYNTLNFNSFDASVDGWVGQSYLAALVNAKFSLLTANPSRLKFTFGATRQKFYQSDILFYKDDQPSFITTSEIFAQLAYASAAGLRGKFETGVGIAHLTDRFFGSNSGDFASKERDQTIRNFSKIFAEYSHNTLNIQDYPTAGSSYRVAAMGIYGHYEFKPFDDDLFLAESKKPLWAQIEASAKNYFPINKHFIFGTEFTALASTRKLLSSYNASIVLAPAFNPTPSSYNSFNPAFRANSFITAGIVPVWKLSEMVQFRGALHGFLPFRKIKEKENHSPYYGNWFSNPEFFGEVAAVVTLPFASVTAYGNFMSYPSHNWNFGLSFGLFFLAPKFLR